MTIYCSTGWTKKTGHVLAFFGPPYTLSLIEKEQETLIHSVFFFSKLQHNNINN